MSFPAPPAPEFPPDQAVTYSSHLRYEDCIQDGRLAPIAMPPSLAGLWQHVISRHPGTRAAIASGVVPILTRLTIATVDQPIRVDRAIETRAGFVLAHDLDGDAVSRLYLNTWTEVRGIAGRIGPRQVDGALEVAGTVFGEHTYTRLFAPAGQRGVTRFSTEGYPEVPALRYAAPPMQSAQDAPDGGTWLDERAADPATAAFTLDDTDANQHVNSMVYIRVFLDAVRRRLAATGRSLVVRSRAVDIAYRKPCFAGDVVRAHVRLYERGGALGAAGSIVGADGKPRCYVRVSLGA